MIIAFAWFLVLPTAMALGYLAIEIILGVRPVSLSRRAQSRVTMAIVIPAHNEASIIAETVRSLRNILPPSTQILVVADNCSDDTAALAREAGSTVIERNDALRRGKGFALAFAQDHLAFAPPDAVVILDADCRVKRGNLMVLAEQTVALNAPVQCVNLLSAPPDASSLVLLSNFAMLMKNLVRARGLSRLGGGIPLFGTGMTFPWSIFGQLDLATADAVEDMRLSLDLAYSGIRVRMSEAVEVVSQAAELSDSLGQRSRWEHGFLRTAAMNVLPLLFLGVVRRSRHLIALGLHMIVPPLSLLFLVGAVATAVALGGALVTDTWKPLIIIFVALSAAVAATCIAWAREGREELSIGALAKAPLYIVWKLPLYVGLLMARQTQWNRTRRVNEKP